MSHADHVAPAPADIARAAPRRPRCSGAAGRSRRPARSRMGQQRGIQRRHAGEDRRLMAPHRRQHRIRASAGPAAAPRARRPPSGRSSNCRARRHETALAAENIRSSARDAAAPARHRSRPSRAGCAWTCRTPFGAPVEPDEYSQNATSSAGVTRSASPDRRRPGIRPSRPQRGSQIDAGVAAVGRADDDPRQIRDRAAPAAAAPPAAPRPTAHRRGCRPGCSRRSRAVSSVLIGTGTTPARSAPQNAIGKSTVSSITSAIAARARCRRRAARRRNGADVCSSSA